MSSPRKQWLLKVIAGPNQGAEIGLYAGKTLIGSDGECDVVLHDVMVATQHLELELSETGPMVAAPLGGRVYTNGKRIREARQNIPDFGFVSIGGTHLVIGPADGQWPLLSPADVPELEKEAPPPPEPEPAAAPSAAAPTPDGPRPVDTPAAGSGAAAPAPAAAPSSKFGPVVGVAAGLLLLAGWGIVYKDLVTGGSKDTPVVELPDDEKPAARAQAVVEDFGALGSVKVEEVGGRVSVSGYVDTEAKQREMQVAFRDAVPGIRTKIYSLEKIAASARSLLDARRLPLTVTSLSEGKIKVSGNLPSSEPWLQMRQSLLREVPGLSGIEDAVEIDALRTMLPNTVYVPVPTPVAVSSGVPGQPPVLVPSSPSSAPATASVPATGTPPAAARGPAGGTPQASLPVSPAASVTKPTIASTPVPQPDPRTDFLLTQDTIDTPEATVAIIRVADGGISYVKLSTGGVYYVGGRLPYGGTVAEIEEEQVTIMDKGVKRTLRQGDVAFRAAASTSIPRQP